MDDNHKPLYLTTTLPYINSAPHVGFGAEIVFVDALARFWRQRGRAVFFNTGTDEHGLKIYRLAEQAGLAPQVYADQMAEKFRALKDELNLSWDNFIRTTDHHHQQVAQEFWRRCLASGDIYKKTYQIKYCVGCELEKTDSELVDGLCPLHPKQALELIDEENYFFRFSRYQSALLELYRHRPDFVLPASRHKEIVSFVERGLSDFSISRLRSKLPWGVAVPDDETQVMYVWFDALVNYISVLGWPEDQVNFSRWWPGVQVAGKDNLRQQSAMWPAMLLSAGLPVPQQIFIRGFILSGGQKMSKSLGNVIEPSQLTKRYGIDFVRYLLLREINPFEDSDLTIEKADELYTSAMVNGLGNLTNRILKMAEDHLPDNITLPPVGDDFGATALMDRGRSDQVLDAIWHQIDELNSFIQTSEPFKKIKFQPDQARADIRWLLTELGRIAVALEPFMPATSEAIKIAILAKTKPEPIFARLSHGK